MSKHIYFCLSALAALLGACSSTSEADDEIYVISAPELGMSAGEVLSKFASANPSDWSFAKTIIETHEQACVRLEEENQKAGFTVVVRRKFPREVFELAKVALADENARTQLWQWGIIIESARDLVYGSDFQFERAVKELLGTKKGTEVLQATLINILLGEGGESLGTFSPKRQLDVVMALKKVVEQSEDSGADEIKLYIFVMNGEKYPLDNIAMQRMGDVLVLCGKTSVGPLMQAIPRSENISFKLQGITALGQLGAVEALSTVFDVLEGCELSDADWTLASASVEAVGTILSVEKFDAEQKDESGATYTNRAAVTRLLDYLSGIENSDEPELLGKGFDALTRALGTRIQEPTVAKFRAELLKR
ncbi:MAG: hypothetical protein NUW37_06495 [Planctomycetes bacterium]|nr:hypothetical protein [Planctomycetota bacterium]